ncbi:MAG: substrate-binding domain-containing protein [Bacteroidaceae bacterium]|nr:substrate-binding domain-containing protein [Bacteroidaceae bacterium]
MKVHRLLLTAAFSLSILSGYAEGNTPQPTQPTQPTVDMKGISTKNFPIIDGSDSTTPLRDILMCKLLGFKYKWVRSFMVQYGGPYDIEPQYTCPQEEWRHLELDCLQKSNTHGSFINLLDGKVEVIFTARSMSRDEMVYAEEKGVELIEKPIAKDALAFLVNPANTVEDLSTEQIQSIYIGEITNWSEVGGADVDITPYIRNRNSGSQEKFETMVMAGLTIKEFPEMQIGTGMMAPYYQLERDKSGIAYSPFYYYSVMVANGLTKAIGVDGIPMTKENVRNNTYPYVTDVYAAVRSDIDKSSMAYKLFEYITTEAGQAIVAESGYVTLSEFANIEKVTQDNAPTPYYDLMGRPVTHPTRGIYIKDGRKVVIK